MIPALAQLRTPQRPSLECRRSHLGEIHLPRLLQHDLRARRRLVDVRDRRVAGLEAREDGRRLVRPGGAVEDPGTKPVAARAAPTLRPA